MRALALIVIFAGVVGAVVSADAQLSQSFRSACTEKRTVASWCAQGVSREGWTLKYRAESPGDLMDAYWLYEVWTREKLAVVCVLTGGRGSISMNACQELSEVQ
jgi:hypothetical protein